MNNFFANTLSALSSLSGYASPLSGLYLSLSAEEAAT
jgi:hypothetical protein